MVSANNQSEQEWLEKQLEDFERVLPRYRTYAQVLQEVLDKAARKHAGLSIVQTRQKSTVSFGEKALQKKRVGRYVDPVSRMTDLCGGRVIVPTKAEVKSMSDFIKGHFAIDVENSVDASQRLKPAEFGYRGVHYIVQFKRGVFPTKDVDVEIPEEVFGLKAEVQVKTILEHAWSVFTHDRAYKGAFKIPEKWEREMAALAATLEEADDSFSRIEDGLKRYAASYGASMAEEKTRDQIDNLKTILRHDPKNAELAARIGKLSITLNDWPTAVDVLTQYVNSGYPVILRDLGVAVCKMHGDNPMSKEYKRGQRYLEEAIKADPKDTDAISSLAGTYRGINEDRMCALYRQAFEVDPSDPYPIGNHIECEVSRRKDISIVLALRPFIQNAVNRCRDQADVAMNLPWAFYDMGKLNLLLGKPHESMAAYAKAIYLSHGQFMIDTSLKSLERLEPICGALQGFDWVRKLLLIGLAARFPEDEPGLKAVRELKELASSGHRRLEGPIVIVAGGCDASAEKAIQSHRQAIVDGFQYFQGIVISGGTTAGVSGIVGEIESKYPDSIATIGYLPRKLPAGMRRDIRYSEIRRTTGVGLSLQEPLQYWTDIVASGIPLTQVKVLGVNGGVISSAEYRIALAMGARVAVFRNSGGEAAKLIVDGDWADANALTSLPMDRMTIAAFLDLAAPQPSSNGREPVARAIHESYRAGKTRVSRIEDPSSAAWEQLSDRFKESNHHQSNDISNKLRRLGYAVVKARGREKVRAKFSREDIEFMAEMEHGRWNIERLLDGWKPGGRRDAAGKISPYLVAWDDLPEDVKEWDRDTVRKIQDFLATVGLKVRKV